MQSGNGPRIGGFLAAVLIVAQGAWAQGTITGCVIDTSRGVLPGVEVVASNESAQARAVTGTTGCYELRGLAAGEYTVSVRLAGFAGDSRPSVRVADGHVTPGVDFVMCLAEDAQRDILWVSDGDGLEGAWKKSDLVVHARIAATAPIFGACPSSDVQHTAVVIERLKGEVPGGRLVFRQERWAGEPVPYRVGQELILFLVRRGGELRRLTGPHYAYPISGNTILNTLPDGAQGLTAKELLATLRTFR